MVQLEFKGFLWTQNGRFDIFYSFLDTCYRLTQFMRMILAESCLVLKGRVRLNRYPQTH